MLCFNLARALPGWESLFGVDAPRQTMAPEGWGEGSRGLEIDAPLSLVISFFCFTGIANALDLTDRILPRLQARPKCRPQLLNFPPYNKTQLASILQERLKQVR